MPLSLDPLERSRERPPLSCFNNAERAVLEAERCQRNILNFNARLCASVAVCARDLDHRRPSAMSSRSTL